MRERAGNAMRFVIRRFRIKLASMLRLRPTLAQEPSPNRSNSSHESCERAGESYPDFATVRSIVGDAAGVSTALWLSYLFSLTYLLVAAGSVTHKDIFLGSQIKLPFLSVDLPLLGFFTLVPAVFLIIHLYVLLHFVFFAEKVKFYEPRLSEQEMQLPLNLFILLFVNPVRKRPGPLGYLSRCIAWVSLVFAPTALLLFFQLQFLPYHGECITWWHRMAVIIDLLLLWLLWPEIVSRRVPDQSSARLGRPERWVLAITSALAVSLSLGVATFPGESWEQMVPSFPFRETLVAGDLDPLTRLPRSLWSNRLLLAGIDLGDAAKSDVVKLGTVPAIPSFRARHLEGAVLIDANLPRTDFTLAHLEGASFVRAKLQGSWFDYASLDGAQLDGASSQGASFFWARLEGASLNNALLQGTSLSGTQLQYASLAGAHLQGASLAAANLLQADFEGADLRGANLSKTRLQYASFSRAKLQGVSLEEAFIWQTDFRTGDLSLVRLGSNPTEHVAPPCEGAPRDACDPKDSIDRIRRVIQRYVPEGSSRYGLLHRLDLRESPPDEVVAVNDRWKSLEKSSIPYHSALDDNVSEGLVDLWHDLACDVDGAPFVASRFLDTMLDVDGFHPSPESPRVRKLAASLLAETSCAAYPLMLQDTTMRLSGLTTVSKSKTGPKKPPSNDGVGTLTNTGYHSGIRTSRLAQADRLR